MPSVPTPFIGGTGGPPAGRPGREPFEPPFVVERAERDDTAEDVTPAPAAPEAEERPAQPEPAAPALGEEPVPAAPAPQPTGPPGSEGEALIDEVFREFSLDEELASEPAAPAPTAAPRGEVEKAQPAEIGDGDVPDFLTGADGVGPDLEPTEPRSEAAPHLAADVASSAEELFRGKFGDRIRKLAKELGPAADEETVSRAFAAGYLAAKREGQE